MKEVTRRNFSTLLSAVLVLLGLLLSMRPAYAQFNSGFVGTVVDQSGAAVPNAKIIITNQATNVPSETESASGGDFRVTALGEGTYKVVVSATGFKSWTRSDIVLESNQVRTLYPVLTLGAQTTTVEVRATVAATVTAQSNTSREIGEQTVDSAPLLGRNVYTSLIQLAPGIMGTGLPAGGGQGGDSTDNDSFESEPAYQINAAGQRQESNEYQVDGVNYVSPSRDGATNLTPEPDFVQAIRVTSANFSASEGRYSGALVQVFTKPGTNDLHGSLSEFHSDNALIGRTIFQTCPPGQTGCRAISPFRRNEFGGSLGGPIIKNKLFAYGGFFALESSKAETVAATVETPQFAQWVANNLPSSIANKFMTDGAPASSPTTGFLTVAQLEALTPGAYAAPANLPADLPAVGTIFYTSSPPHTGYQFHVRVDYNFHGDKDRVFFSTFDTSTTITYPNPRPIFTYSEPNHGVTGKLDWTHTFSPSLLNEASFTAYNADGMEPVTAHDKDLPNVQIGGVSGYEQWGPAGWDHNCFNWHDVLNWTRGKHTIASGADVDRRQANAQFTNAEIRPSFYFASLLDFAQDLPFSQYGPPLLVANGELATALDGDTRALYTGVFVQDDWKVTRRFTLNLGLRFDDFGHWATFANSRTHIPQFTAGNGSTFAEQLAYGSMVDRGGKGYVINNNPTGFSPRIGFGWDVFGNGKTALRGGYGIFYNQIGNLSFTSDVPTPPPIWATPSFSIFNNQPFSYGLGNATGTLWPVPTGISLNVNSAGGLGPGIETSGVQANFAQPRAQSWMFAIQHELAKDLILEVDYNGSHSSHLHINTDVNRFGGDLVINKGNQTRLTSNFGPIIYGRSIGTADGEIGTIMLSKRMSNHWQMRGIFTFGKSTDELSSNDNGVANGETVIDPQNLSGQHGLSDFDASKRFAFDSVVEIPTPFKSGIQKAILGGWRMSNILLLQSGLPFTVYTSAPFSPIFDANGNVIGENPGGGDYNADGYDYDVPNAPSFGNNKSTNRRSFITGFAPASAFPMPALGHEGNLGRNTFIGPGMANINSEFTKVMHIPWFTREGASLEFRADIFNLFNRVNLITPISDLSSELFGQSTDQNFARSAQFGIHISF